MKLLLSRKRNVTPGLVISVMALGLIFVIVQGLSQHQRDPWRAKATLASAPRAFACSGTFFALGPTPQGANATTLNEGVALANPYGSRVLS